DFPFLQPSFFGPSLIAHPQLHFHMPWLFSMLSPRRYPYAIGFHRQFFDLTRTCRDFPLLKHQPLLRFGLPPLLFTCLLYSLPDAHHTDSRNPCLENMGCSMVR